MRRILTALVLVFAAAGEAQAQTPDPARAVAALAANWRPIATNQLASPAAVETACAGAVEEIAAVEAMLPADINTAGLARVRGLHGLVIVPAEETAEETGSAFFFPPRELAWFSSGLGAIAVLDEGQGILSLRDAAGANIGLQLGRAGGHTVLRVRPPQGAAMQALVTFVGCAPTAPP